MLSHLPHAVNTSDRILRFRRYSTLASPSGSTAASMPLNREDFWTPAPSESSSWSQEDDGGVGPRVKRLRWRSETGSPVPPLSLEPTQTESACLSDFDNAQPFPARRPKISFSRVADTRHHNTRAAPPSSSLSLSLFRFSEEVGVHTEGGSTAESTFHRLIQQAAACTHVSLNFHRLSPYETQTSLSNTVTQPSPTDPFPPHTSTEADDDIVTRPRDCVFKAEPLFTSEPSEQLWNRSTAATQEQFYSDDSALLPVEKPASGSCRIKNAKHNSEFASIDPELQNPNDDDQPLMLRKESCIMDFTAYETFSDLDALERCEETASQLSALEDLDDRPLFSPQTRPLFSPGRAAKHDNSQLNLSPKSRSGTCTCAICLTDLDDIEDLGHLAACNHLFCCDCIVKWSNVSNRCPLCKQSFRVITHSQWSITLPKRLVQVASIEVEDKVLRVQDEDDPSVAQAQAALDDYVCQVCRDGNHEEVLLLCDGCDDAYHTFCVGLDEIPAGSWYCHICSNENERQESQQTSETGNIGRRMMNDVVRFWNRAFATHLGRSGGGRRTRYRSRTSDVREERFTRSQPSRRTPRRTVSSNSNDTVTACHRPITRSVAARLQVTGSSVGSGASESDDLLEVPVSSQRRLRRHTVIDDVRNSAATSCRSVSALEQRIRRRWSSHRSTPLVSERSSFSPLLDSSDAVTLERTTRSSLLPSYELGATAESSPYCPSSSSCERRDSSDFCDRRDLMLPALLRSNNSPSSSSQFSPSGSVDSSQRQTHFYTPPDRLAALSPQTSPAAELMHDDVLLAVSRRCRRLRKARTIDIDEDHDDARHQEASCVLTPRSAANGDVEPDTSSPYASNLTDSFEQDQHFQDNHSSSAAVVRSRGVLKKKLPCEKAPLSPSYSSAESSPSSCSLPRRQFKERRGSRQSNPRFFCYQNQHSCCSSDSARDEELYQNNGRGSVGSQLWIKRRRIFD